MSSIMLGGSTGIRQRRLSQDWRILPGPPKAGMSRHFAHSPQFGVVQPVHEPQRRRFPPPVARGL
eukprot:scaffold65312_cov33-Tisochrysis_lutea.AAC.6